MLRKITPELWNYDKSIKYQLFSWLLQHKRLRYVKSLGISAACMHVGRASAIIHEAVRCLKYKRKSNKLLNSFKIHALLITVNSQRNYQGLVKEDLLVDRQQCDPVPNKTRQAPVHDSVRPFVKID